MKELIFPLLEASDIEVKIKKASAKGAIALLYKTARTDMHLLDTVVGPHSWECDYKVVNDNLYCGIGIHTDNGVIWKWDCGTESREDGEGNEKKGEASDAFKRAGFRWGIGRELYTSPMIFLKVETEQAGNGYRVKNPFERYRVSEIGYTNRRISNLVIVDKDGIVVFRYEEKRQEPEKIGEVRRKELVQLVSQKFGGNAKAVFTELTGYASTSDVPISEYNAIYDKIANA